MIFSSWNRSILSSNRFQSRIKTSYRLRNFSLTYLFFTLPELCVDIWILIIQKERFAWSIKVVKNYCSDLGSFIRFILQRLTSPYTTTELSLNIQMSWAIATITAGEHLVCNCASIYFITLLNSRVYSANVLLFVEDCLDSCTLTRFHLLLLSLLVAMLVNCCETMEKSRCETQCRDSKLTKP